MDTFIPAFDFQRVFVEPWTSGLSTYGWIMLMGFLAGAACGLVGQFLILRRMALVGDAISHSVLPGLVLAFLVTQWIVARGSGDPAGWMEHRSLAMFAGALGAGVLTTLLIEVIHRKSRIKQDAAIGIVFSSLFAIGVILLNLFAGKVDLDQECVLYGEIAFVTPGLQPDVQIAGVSLGPLPVVRMAMVATLTAFLILACYKELLVSSFDPGLAASLGINAGVLHYGLMTWLSLVVVSAFEAVGAILVIAMLILPGATASLISTRLPVILMLSVVQAACSAVLGLHLALWLECSIAAAMVVVSSILFTLAWIGSPSQGLIARWWHLRFAPEEPVPELPRPVPAGEAHGSRGP